MKEAEINRRVDVMAGREPFDPRGLEGELTWPALYDRVAEIVEPGGDVLVLGYPRIIEEPDRWPLYLSTWAGPYSATLASCQLIHRDDVPMLRRVSDYVNGALRETVESADARHSPNGVRFHFLNIAESVYETGGESHQRHNLCSDDPYLNGITVGLTSGDFRGKRSFHPNQKGHDATAAVVANHVRDEVTFDDAPRPTGTVLNNVDWTSLIQNRLDCVTGRVELYGEPERFDVNGDGAVDAVVEYSCFQPTSSGFSQVEVFDGASRTGSIESLGIILARPADDDWAEAIQTGMKVYSTSFDGRTITLRGRMYQYDDPNGCPSLDGSLEATWTAEGFSIAPLVVQATETC
ncbi:hypothetical protein [Pseudonocardia sp. NPDC049635]|uniref:hypothetical protein n=1 Tax=Pseudonocardia sp. NPDC049635 TaxID=3155506 RepID=UPI003400ED82